MITICTPVVDERIDRDGMVIMQPDIPLACWWYWYGLEFGVVGQASRKNLW